MGGRLSFRVESILPCVSHLSFTQTPWPSVGLCKQLPHPITVYFLVLDLCINNLGCINRPVRRNNLLKVNTSLVAFVCKSLLNLIKEEIAESFRALQRCQVSEIANLPSSPHSTRQCGMRHVLLFLLSFEYIHKHPVDCCVFF